MNDLPEDDTRIRLSDEVAEALHAGTPVVALESPIIPHGLPHPRNLETAHAIETVVRENGSVPATVALLDGVIQVGLEDSDLDRIATSGDVAKVSLRDIGWVRAGSHDRGGHNVRRPQGRDQGVCHGRNRRSAPRRLR